VAKGVGMIEPNMATTLSFVFTDLKISESTLKKIHKNICNETFNSISVDGEQSPSDSSILVATGKNLIKSPKLLKIFEKSLLKIFTELSEKLLLDGEGATKLIEIEVSGLKSKIACKEVAKKIANSPLLKTAAYGEDPNWGRILSAAGNTENKFQEKDVSLKIGKIKVLEKGEIHKKYKESLGKKEFKKKRISLSIILGSSKHSAKVKSSDLTHEYVSINSDYRS
jgi:glutamate N-acetyltransferase/amino-acid N-acetyltransferase